MHLLATTSGVIDGSAEAIDLKQDPADVIILTAADSEIALLAAAHKSGNKHSLRLANMMQLQHHLSVDTYIERTVSGARLVIIRLLGGKSYWSYGIESLHQFCSSNGTLLAVIAGEADFNGALLQYSTLDPHHCRALHGYFARGGPQNAALVLEYAGYVLGSGAAPDSAVTFSQTGIFHDSRASTGPRAAIVFYRSLAESGQTAPIESLCKALEELAIGVCAVFVPSLKDAAAQAFITSVFENNPPDVIINATAFAVGDEKNDPLSARDCPVLQVSLAGLSKENWETSSAGLGAKDLTMHVVMPELDGRIFTRAISFKQDSQWDAATQCRLVKQEPLPDRIAYVAELARAWARLRHKPNSQKHVAIVLANYPNKDGRIANGVGLDTPASTIAVIESLSGAGFEIEDIPVTGNALIEKLQAGRTNAKSEKHSRVAFHVSDYTHYYNALPDNVKAQVEKQWGSISNDPMVMDGAFQLPLVMFGNVVAGIQPARGYNIDPKATYHDAALVPPHNYFAFYFWIRHVFAADAIIHMGKHGNLEWMPGKSTGLSSACMPDAVLGAIPQLYPFIVNDPGEGTQAKRRTSAVIVDHLIPPLTRAETYGPLKDLEALVDEYYLASGLDKRRIKTLRDSILDLTRSHKLDSDAGFTGDAEQDLVRLDTFLCDLKESQIRDGLHIFGTSPDGKLETDLLCALTRTGSHSLIKALVQDLDLGPFDPFACNVAENWQGPKPKVLVNASSAPWRSNGDTIERLELLASNVIESNSACGPASLASLKYVKEQLKPTLRSCGLEEMRSITAGLEGRRIAAGPSGAPTRGRIDVLPTGRNFYSVDNRALPTPAAWELGKASAQALLQRHFQDHGSPLRSVALSCWGTSNMRTGGDDIAQAMALIGVQPIWDTASWRVTGFEVIPMAKLGRPRTDVTLRISGLFRDAFPAQIELFDKAVKAVAELDEDAEDNPIAASRARETADLIVAGISHVDALSLSTARIFGSKPGGYGAGLQALIDEKIWASKADLAAAFVTWGAYVYGARVQGLNDENLLRTRLKSVQAVLHNQDNREHDLLDSDDYYQFEGGLNAAVHSLSGKKPASYHMDHSRPERPVARTLDEEIARVVRSRVINPKWINGVKRHGYKGAFEIAATVDYMFAFAATADAVKSHHFDLAYDAYLIDDETRNFLQANNPAALKEIAARLEEAIARGLWQPRLNSAYDHLKELQK